MTTVTWAGAGSPQFRLVGCCNGGGQYRTRADELLDGWVERELSVPYNSMTISFLQPQRM